MNGYEQGMNLESQNIFIPLFLLIVFETSSPSHKMECGSDYLNSYSQKKPFSIKKGIGITSITGCIWVVNVAQMFTSPNQ